MNTEYKRENHKSYLVIKNCGKEEENYDLKMLGDNPINGLLPISRHVFNGEEELYYDISTKQPLSVLYEKREMRKEDLEKLFGSMKEAVVHLEEYLLDVEGFILGPDYIYIGGDEKLYLLYYPYEKEDFREKIYEFAEYILTRVCNEDEKAVVYAYSFYRYIKEENGDLQEALARLGEDGSFRTESDENRTGAAKEWENEGFSEESVEIGLYLDEDAQIMEDISRTQKETNGYKGFMGIVFFIVTGLGGLGILIYSAWKYNLTWQSLFSRMESVTGVGICMMSVGGIILFKGMEYVKIKKRAKLQEGEDNIVFEKAAADFHEEFCEPVFENPDVEEREEDIKERNFETVLLQDNCYREQRVLRGRVKGRKKEIDLSTFPFIIGKNREQVDYVLEDSSISRIHARFTLRDDVVYLTDLNSTNGTLKNGIRLEPNELTMLEADDEITFGRLSFTYH